MPLEHPGGRLTRLAVERVDGDAARGVLGVGGLDHVVLHVGAEAVLRPEDGRQRDARLRCDAVEHVPAGGIDRRGIADHAHAASAQRS